MQLTAEDMLGISQEISRSFAPRRFRPSVVRSSTAGFSPQELLSISQQISREFAPRIGTIRAAKLVALPVDPEHLHVYWQLDDAQKLPETLEMSANEKQPPLTLRVFSHAEPNAIAIGPVESKPTWFDVAVERSTQNQQDITLPPGAACMAGIYQVAIGRLDALQEFSALAYSNTAATAPQISPAKERLSPGMAQFIILPSQASSALAANASGQNNN